MKKYLAIVFLGISMILSGCYAQFSSRDYGFYEEYDEYGYYKVADYEQTETDTTQYSADQIGDYIGSDTTVYMTDEGRVIEINNYFTVAQTEQTEDSLVYAYKPGTRKYYLDYYPSTHLTIAAYTPNYFWYDPWYYDPWYYDYWYFGWNYYPSYWHHYPHWGWYGYYPYYEFNYYGNGGWAYNPSQYKYRDNYSPGGRDRNGGGSGSNNVGMIRGDIGGNTRDPGRDITHLGGGNLRDLDVARIDPKTTTKGSENSTGDFDKGRGISKGEVSDVKKFGDNSRTSKKDLEKNKNGFETTRDQTKAITKRKSSSEFRNNKKLLDALKNKIAENPRGSSPTALREIVNNSRNSGSTSRRSVPKTTRDYSDNTRSNPVPNYTPPPAGRSNPNSGRSYGESTPTRRTSPPKSYSPPRTNSSPKTYSSPPKSRNSGSRSYSTPSRSSGSSKSTGSSRSSSSSSRSSSGSKSRK